MLEKILKAQLAAWGRGERKLVETILAEQFAGQSIESFNKDDLLSLICSEDALRRKQGEQPTLQEYQSRFPQLSDELAVQWEINAMLLASVPSEQAAKIKPQTLNVVPIVVGRYSIRREIGRGAMGIVYEAYDPTLKRIVAIKRLRSGSDADESELQRISSEAEAVAQLNHPNIVQLFDVEMDKNVPHLVMEYCTGGTLESYMNGKPLDAMHAVTLMLQIAAGVAAAHAVGIVHRDLKPANVMLDNRLTLKPKVSDFGLAKRLGLDSNATATGTLIGSPAYMPPEQATGGGKDIGPAADVYSLGAVLYECLTGRPPFRGSSLVDTLDQVRTREPVQVRQLEPRVPRDLETIVHKCLRKRADQRYAHASEFADDLRRFLNHERIHARRENWLEASSRVFRRYPLASSLAAVTTALLLVITIGSLLFARKYSGLLRQSELVQAEALIGRAHGLRLSRKPGQRFESLASLKKATEIGRRLNLPNEWFDNVRNETIGALMLPDVWVENWHEEREVPLSADFSNDHLYYAVSFGALDEVEVRELDSHRELGRIASLGPDTRVRWAAKSIVFLYSESKGNCELWDVAQMPFKMVRRFDSGCNYFSFSGDQEWLIIADSQWMQVIKTQNGEVQAKFRSAPFSRQPQMAFHPTKPWMACCSYSYETVEIRNWRTGGLVQELRPGRGSNDRQRYSTADWSPDGKNLIILQGDGEAQYHYQLHAESDRLELIQVDRPARICARGGPVIRFNAAGDRILSRSWAPTLELFDFETNRSLFLGSGVVLLNTGHVSELPRIDPQEQYGSFGTNPSNFKALGLTSLAVGREAKVVIPTDRYALGRLFDPQNMFLLGLCEDGFMIIDSHTGKPLLKHSIQKFNVQCFAFDREGNFYLNGLCGCYRWPYEISKSEPYALELGIPERLNLPFGAAQISCSNDGSTIFASAANAYGSQAYAGGWIKTHGEPAGLKVFGGDTMSACSVSPDGRYVAACSTKATLVWNCSTKPEKVAEYSGGHDPRFICDSSWLLAADTMIKTGEWEPSVSFNDGIPYDLSNDGSCVTVVKNDGSIGIASARTGETLAIFSGPDDMFYPVLSPDGERIACYSNQNGMVLINLRNIRAALSARQLDWNSPPFPAAKSLDLHRIESARVVPELQGVDTEDELSDLVDRETIRRFEADPNNADAVFSAAMISIERWEYPQAMKLLNSACQLLPESIAVRQWRAYLLAAMRDYEKAIIDANWVLKRFENSDFRLLRAEWHYHAKQYELAMADCLKVIEKEDYLTKYAYGLRSKCYEALGQAALAAEDQTKFIALTRSDSKSLTIDTEPMAGMDISVRRPVIAMQLMHKIQTLNIDLPNELRHVIARVLYVNDRYDQVVNHLESCLAQDCEQYESSNLYLLALAKHQLGQHESAVEILARAEACPIPLSFDYRARRNLRLLRAECRSVVLQDTPSVP